MVEKLKSQISSMQKKLVKCEDFLQNIKKHIHEIEEEVEQLELLKYYVCF